MNVNTIINSAIDQGVNMFRSDKVSRHGVGEKLSRCSLYLGTDGDVKCVICNQYNIYDPCLNGEGSCVDDADSKFGTGTLLCYGPKQPLQRSSARNP